MISLNPNKAKGTRFSHKLETLFWWFLRLLPILSYLFYCFGSFQSNALWEDYLSHIEDGFSFIPFSEFFQSFFRFPPSEFFDSLFSSVFGPTGVFPFTTSYYCDIFSYLSYCVSIEILRLMYHVVVFIPRLASKWISAAVQDD